jgi:hypothetical protein
MSLYQRGPPRPRVLAKALIAPVPVLGFASLLAVRSHRVADALFVFAMLILPMTAFTALLFLLSGAEPDHGHGRRGGWYGHAHPGALTITARRKMIAPSRGMFALQ